LDLVGNKIWDEWARALAEKLELKEWVKLCLLLNNIWDDWARELGENLELKEWVILDLRRNKIWDEMKQKLREREKSYHDKWINCKVII
jgi:hypothetical protein